MPQAVHIMRILKMQAPKNEANESGLLAESIVWQLEELERHETNFRKLDSR